MNLHFDDTYFSCTLCDDDNDPDPRFRRVDKDLCVRCNRGQQQARTYSLSIAQVNGIPVQRDACALCEEEPNYEFGRVDEAGQTFWNIDHDHAYCGRAGSCGRCVIRDTPASTPTWTTLPPGTQTPSHDSPSPTLLDELPKVRLADRVAIR